MSFTPTDEQVAALDGFRSNENMTIEALAGTGKTSTLRLIADEAGTGRRGLYLAFNKAIQLEADRKFAGTGVTAKTAHSLAFPGFGRPMHHKLERGMRMRAAERAEILGIKNKLGVSGGRDELTMISKHVAVRLTLEAVTNFCRSADDEIGPQHVPVPETLMLAPSQIDDYTSQIVRLARRYWADAQDTNGRLPYTHDFYLKAYAMSQPKLEVDYILFDEAQDADATMAQIVAHQTHAQIIAVGDRNQAIYGWRGATDAMDWFGGNRFALTRSFRFGDAIADEANQWLQLLESDLRVVGSDKPSSVHESRNRVPEAVLTRTNAGAIGEVIGLLTRNEGTVGIGGKGKAMALRDLAEAAKTLKEQGWTRHPELDMFESWDAVVEFTQEDEGADLAPLVNLIERYGPDHLIRSIDSTVDPVNARTVVSTVHVAKGLEWHHVRIADDFKVPNIDEETGEYKHPTDADLMLSYVAVTRAVRHLDAGGLGWVRDYARLRHRPEVGVEWRRRFQDARRDFREDQDIRAELAAA